MAVGTVGVTGILGFKTHKAIVHILLNQEIFVTVSLQINVKGYIYKVSNLSLL